MTFSYALNYFNNLALGKPQPMISEEVAAEIRADEEESKDDQNFRRPKLKTDSIFRSLSSSDGNNSGKKQNNAHNSSYAM